ncbi:ribose transport system ATP-binding protein/rhamnose transport system ATP-binding protein [Cereibacter changlensis]|uniref:Ribose transport system ATP-binding protein/rhamnose transport system ATP-binding protein n=2 Tax=Cereibacter changlensis TaxID=402884 RepID=A0A2W7R5Q1_9RHOB|nr:sugar ABC transporter ATP-binding protein [Cereibacter changlensis]PZX56168.1 ribose transport system ATP-binding protein/rhamnose transport system ATP-binding protein [Cereibacter changlensis]
MTAEPILSLSGVSKSYGAVRALQGVGFTVARGEVHAILGENGAGKSTTLKIIHGEVEPDEGEVRLAGKPSTAAERSHGDIAMVHQELAVFPNMSVAENIFVGRMPRRGGRIDFARMRARATELLELFGLSLDPREILGQLTPGQQQIVEILRAVESDASLLILDEPTSGLNNLEAETLMRLIQRLRASGHTILYVSHRLHEVLEIADQITVLRDGQFVETLANRGLTEDDLIRRMVGRNLDPVSVPEAGRLGDAPVALRIEGMTQPGSFEDMALEVRRGEIVGLFGLEGSGAEEFSRAIFGIVPPVSGRVELLGQRVTDLTPHGLMRRGLSYLPANRKEEGLYMERSIADNIAAPILRRLSRLGLVNRASVDRQATADIKRFAIRVPGPDGLPRQLSGGNQQKVMLSACLASAPEVIVLNEPTRGVDVGAKAEVHEVARREAAAGRAVLVFSSDLPELLRLAHRIVVMRSRRGVGEIAGRDMSEESVMALAAGSR